MSPDANDIAASAAWHLHDIDFGSGRASLLRLDEAAYRAASFLDPRAEPLATGQAVWPLEKLREVLSGFRAATPHLIFHLGHCGSTLLSRALDASPAVLPVREPQPLRWLAANPAGGILDTWLEPVLRAHGRTFHPGQRPVIKATSTCNRLIRPVLEHRPDARAVLMYVDLETYLAGLLGKQTPALDLTGHLPARLADWSRLEGATPLEGDRLNEAERAALAWLTGMKSLVSAIHTVPERTRLLDFERFLDDPETNLSAVVTWLGLTGDLDAVLEAWPDVSTGYSKKPDEPYSAFNRRRTLQRGRLTRPEDIRHGLRWAEARIRDVPALGDCAPFLAGNPDAGA